MDSLAFTFGPHERGPLGASADFAHRSTMGEVTWLSIREAGFESPAVHGHRSSSGQDSRFSADKAGFDSLAVDLAKTIKRQPDLGPLISGPGRASRHQSARS